MYEPYMTMHQVAGTELAATVNWSRKFIEVNKSPVLLRVESGTCNEYFISLFLIGCQFSMVSLQGPIFNHFCNVRAMCAAWWSLSGRVALFLLPSAQTEHARNVYVATNVLPVSQNNTAYIYCNWMTRLAFRIEIKWQKKKEVQEVFHWIYLYRGLQAGKGAMCQNCVITRRLKKKNCKPATVATLI